MIIFVLFTYSCPSDSFMLRNHILITSKYYGTFFLNNISIVAHDLNLAFEDVTTVYASILQVYYHRLNTSVVY